MKIKDDAFTFVLFGGLFCFIILASVGKSAGPAAWMDFVGSIIGSAITIIGAYIIFHLQTDATDQRQLATVRALLQELGAAGGAMAEAAAELDPAKHVREASIAYGTVLSVAAAMSASGPKIARVSEQLRVAPEAAQLRRLEDAAGAIAAADLHARGGEIRVLADSLVEMLRNGL